MDVHHLKPIPQFIVFSNLFTSVAFRVMFSVSVLLAVILAPITYWALDNQRPYAFDASKSVIIPNVAIGNDQMIVKWWVHVYRQCDGIITRELFDPQTQVILAVYDQQRASLSAVARGPGTLNKTFLLPRQIQTGRIGYRSRLEYYCNPLQRIWPIRYQTPDLFFEVRA